MSSIQETTLRTLRIASMISCKASLYDRMRVLVLFSGFIFTETSYLKDMDRNTTRPQKNRNSEAWRKVGNVSTAQRRKLPDTFKAERTDPRSLVWTVT